MTLYATLDDVQSVMMGEQTAQTAAARNKILSDLRVVSRRIDREFQSRRPLFAPYVEARRFPVTSERVNSTDGTFRLDGTPLLAIAGVVVGDTTLTVDTTVEGWPDPDLAPFPYLRLMECCQGWYSYCAPDCSGPLYVTVTGTWGWHRDYANAWMKVDDLAGDINASATTLTVADVDGADLYGLTPRISAGNLLRIGTELLEVTATDTGTNAVTVRRGVNGSTAAAHTTGDDVYTWQVEEPIRRAVARQTALLYARRGAYTTVEVQGMSEVRFPSDLLSEVRAILADYSYGV